MLLLCFELFEFCLMQLVIEGYLLGCGLLLECFLFFVGKDYLNCQVFGGFLIVVSCGGQVKFVVEVVLEFLGMGYDGDWWGYGGVVGFGC